MVNSSQHAGNVRSIAIDQRCVNESDALCGSQVPDFYFVHHSTGSVTNYMTGIRDRQLLPYVSF